MKACPFCKEQIQDEAIKCRFCGSSLLPPQPSETSAKDSAADDRRVTYVLDTDLIRFGKFAASVLAVFVTVGLFLYGMDIKDSLKEIKDSLTEATASKDGAGKSRDEAQKAKDEAEKAAKSAAEEATRDLTSAQNALKESNTLLDEESKKADEINQRVAKVAEMEKNVTSARDQVNQAAADAQRSLGAAKEDVNALHTLRQQEALKAGQPAGSEEASAEPSHDVSEHANPTSATHDFSPLEIARLYNYPSNLKGKGQTIGFVELGGGYTEASLKQYFTKLNLSVPKITSVSVDGGTNSPGDPNGADGQVQADIEILGAIVPEASMIVYFAPNMDQGFVDAIRKAESDSRVSILTISWGGAETSWSRTALTAINSALEDATARGITVVVASGDLGVTDGTANKTVDFPASSPWVLAVGGASITVSNNQIASEVVWNDLPSGGASGGGISAVFPTPSWQATVRLPGSSAPLKGRALPDVSMHVNPTAGYHFSDRRQG